MARKLYALVALVLFAGLMGCLGRLEPAADRSSEGADAQWSGEVDAGLSQKEVRKAFAAIGARMTGEMVGETRETVTGVEIDAPDDPDEPPGESVTVRVAAVQWLTCGCCSHSPADTPFSDTDLALVGRLERIGKLTVNRTRITDAGLQMLSRHPGLTHLDLSSNQLTDEVLRHIGHLKNLEVLNLSNTQITGTGLRHLEDLDRLRELRLNHAPVIDDALQYLSGLTGLERLHLDSTRVTGAGFARVRGLERLEELSLNQSGATSEGLAHLSAFPSLQKLAVGGTVIDDQGLAHLRGLRALRSLHANDTSITDEGLRHLAEAMALETINLANTGVKGFGINHLRDCLGLRVLRLGRSSRDGGIQADAETIETLNRFKSLDSLALDLSQESAASNVVLSEMPDLQLLVIHCGPSMGRIELSDLPQLRTLEIRGMDQPRYGSSYQGLVDAETVPRIEEITLRNVGKAAGEDSFRGYTLPIRTVLPQVLRLNGVGNAFFPEVTGRVHAEHAEALAAFDVARVDAIAGSDPVAVASIFSGEKQRR